MLTTTCDGGKKAIPASKRCKSQHRRPWPRTPLALANNRFKTGIDRYLNVITVQTTLLLNQQTALTLRKQQMTTSVQLIMALGGGWNASQIPEAGELVPSLKGRDR